MNLGSDIAAAIPELRAAAESLFVDTFTVHRRTGEVITDPDTLEETPEYAVVHASVKGKLKSSGSQNRAVQTPGVQVSETSPEWHTSVDVAGILTDDEVECIASVYDPDLVGVRVRITGPFVQSIATARRFRVEELT